MLHCRFAAGRSASKLSGRRLRERVSFPSVGRPSTLLAPMCGVTYERLFSPEGRRNPPRVSRLQASRSVAARQRRSSAREVLRHTRRTPVETNLSLALGSCPQNERRGSGRCCARSLAMAHAATTPIPWGLARSCLRGCPVVRLPIGRSAAPRIERRLHTAPTLCRHLRPGVCCEAKPTAMHASRRGRVRWLPRVSVRAHPAFRCFAGLTAMIQYCDYLLDPLRLRDQRVPVGANRGLHARARTAVLHETTSITPAARPAGVSVCLGMRVAAEPVAVGWCRVSRR